MGQSRNVSPWSLARFYQRLSAPMRARIISLALFLGTGTVLAIAMWLTPAPEGHGTHLQLGLYQCTFLTATGYPCPVCGATTTFTLWAHLHPLLGIINQPFASALFLLTAGTFGVSTVELVSPRGRWDKILHFVDVYELRLAVGFLVLMCGSWLYKTWLMGLL